MMHTLVQSFRLRSAFSLLFALSALLLLVDESYGQRRFRLFRARRCANVATVANVAAATAPAPTPKWNALFDGKTLANWKSANFGGEGEVKIENGQAVLEMGTPMTGITWTGDAPPRTNYEIEVEAKRLEGIDFFCGLTFPVGDSHCSFIPSGWAGAVVGLSSIDGFDASDNETTQYFEFKDNQWYRFRVRVEPKHITVWIDDEKIIDVDIEGRKISTRAEVDLSYPLGISAYETKAAIRNIRIRKLGE